MSRAVSAEITVAEIARDPSALDVLKRMGINHCCGAHLSLREAAAAAGVSLDTLLRALAGAAEAHT
jgi:iron-sulfur cluster repair protein YtfE (RIC family)